MDDKIKQLTDKILAEGVEKGKQQADELLDKAKKRVKKYSLPPKNKRKYFLKKKRKKLMTLQLIQKVNSN